MRPSIVNKSKSQLRYMLLVIGKYTQGDGTMNKLLIKHISSVFLFCITLLLQGCGGMPEIPNVPQATETSGDYYDEYGCFPVDCDLPAGMKELCQDYQAGVISWPEDCSVMPGEACQMLCATDKAARGVDLPTTVVDAYQAGWMEPIQLDDHLGDALRDDFEWAFIAPVVDNDGRVLLVYSALVDGIPQYYRYWDGESLTEPQRWEGPQGLQVLVYDSQNRLHIISEENMGEDDQYLAHSIWDGETFIREPIFKGQFIQPTLGVHNLAIDENDTLHLAFWERSRGVREVWYTSYDGSEWSEPVCVSNTLTDSWNAFIDVGRDGHIYIAWPEDAVDQTIEVASGSSLFTYYENGAWSEPISGGFASVRVDSKGIVHSIGENLYSYWDGESWSDPVQIEYPGYATAMYHYIIDNNDTVIFVWNRYTNLDQPTEEGYIMKRELMTRRRYADGSWSPVMTLGVWDLTPTYNEVHTMLATDQNGVVHAATSGNFEGGIRQYYLNMGAPVEDESLATLEVMPPQPAWVPYPTAEPIAITAGEPSGWNTVETNFISSTGNLDLDFVLDDEGTLHTTWQELVGEDYEILYSSFHNGMWSETVNISQREGLDYDAEIAMDETENLYVGWKGSIPGTTSAFVSEFDGESWSEPQRISKEITWDLSSAMIPIHLTQENITRPVIEAGAEGQAIMMWEHISEGVSNAIAYSIHVGEHWEEEKVPIEEMHFPYAGDRSSMDYDSEGNIHLVFTFSGNMEDFDVGMYLKLQIMYSMYDGTEWSDPVDLMPLPDPDEPINDMAAQSSIAAVTPDLVYVIFSMRPFERAYSPYHIPTENSNAYLVFWDGEGWTEPRRLDEGTAFGPSFVDIVADEDGLAHIVWSKYDVYNQHYAVYYTTSDGNSESEIIKIWESETEQEMYPILKPIISINNSGKIGIGFETEMDGSWVSYLTTYD